MGRWINRDPLGEYGSKNLHLANSNDFINKYDIFGLYWEGAVKGTLAHEEFFKWGRAKYSYDPGMYFNTTLRLIFEMRSLKQFSDNRPDVLHVGSHQVWELKPYHMTGVTSTERSDLKKYLTELTKNGECYTAGVPAYIVQVRTRVGFITDPRSGDTEEVWVFPSDEKGFINYSLNKQKKQEEYYEVPEKEPINIDIPEIPWYYWPPAIIWGVISGITGLGGA